MASGHPWQDVFALAYARLCAAASSRRRSCRPERHRKQANIANLPTAIIGGPASPDVARGLALLKQAGWRVRLYNTMQVLGIAWRGSVAIPEHVKYPSVPNLFYSYLRNYPAS